MRKKISRSKGATQTQQRLTEAAEGAIRRDRGRPAPAPFTAEELRKIAGEISARELPEPGATRLELMEIDPWNVHAYWHIKASDMARCRARLTGSARDARLVLRFSDISAQQDATGPHEKFDIEVGEDCNHWYVNLWRDAKHYSGEIGLRAADGTFEPLARSNEIVTPRAGPSPDLDFVLVEARAPNLPEPASAIMPRVLHDDLLRNLFPQRPSLQDEFPLLTQDAFHPYLDEPAFPALDESDGIAALHDQQGADTTGADLLEETRSFPILMKDELDHYGQQARESRGKTLAGGKLPPLEPPPEGMVAPTDIVLVSQTLPMPFPTARSEETLPPTAGEPSEMAGTAGDHPLSGNYSADPRLAKGMEETHAPLSIALEMLAGKSTFSPAAVDNAFDIAASLLVEGTCPPNSRLVLFGKPVHVEADGTFTVKLPLECGPELVELLYRARSRQDKE